MPMELVEQDQVFADNQIVWKLPKDKFSPDIFSAEEIKDLGLGFQNSLVQQGKIDNNAILVIAWL